MACGPVKPNIAESVRDTQLGGMQTLHGGTVQGLVSVQCHTALNASMVFWEDGCIPSGTPFQTLDVCST